MAVVVAVGPLQAMRQPGQAYEEEAPPSAWTACFNCDSILGRMFESYFWDAVAPPQLGARDSVIIHCRCYESVRSRVLSGCSNAIDENIGSGPQM